MKHLIFSILFLGLFSSGLRAQSQSAGWLGSFNTIKTGKKTSLHYDMQFRSSDKLEAVQTMLFRPGINYHFRKNMIATIGYGLIEGRRIFPSATGYVPEHRIWEQYILNQNLGKSATLQHRLRLEQRWIGQAVAENGSVKASGFENAHRIRYFARSIIPLNRQQGGFTKGMFLAAQNEIFINLGDKSNVNGKIFDQNRFYLATGYRLSKKIDLEAGYLNQYVSGRADNFSNTHIAQLALYTRL